MPVAALVAVLVGLVSFSGLAATASPAVSAPPVAAPADEPTDDQELQEAPLARATAALSGDDAAAGTARVEATLALRDLFLARPTLDDLGRRLAGGLLARPTAGDDDPFADGYRVPSTRVCSAHVCVHRVRSTSDSADPAWAATTLEVMEEVWDHHVDRFGYRRPATDGRRGGSAKFDVYLKDLGSRGVYGYCAPERRVTGQPKQASGFCVLDNDFARSQYGRAPLETLRVTASHEFFHAVQFAYDFGEDQWLLEQTATWMEERFADDVDDNRIYLPYGQISRPGTSLDLFEPAGFAQYGNWTFWEYLSDRYGRSVVRRVIQRTGTGGGLPDDFSAKALRKVLRREGGLSPVFAAYAAGNTRPRRTYPEGAAFPAAPVTSRSLGPSARRTQVSTTLDHLSSRTVRIRPDAALRADRWRLRLSADTPGGRTSPAVLVVVERGDGTVRRRLVRLDETGAGTALVPFSAPSTHAVSVTLANGSSRFRCDQDTSLSCRGEARDQAQPFTLTVDLERRPPV